MARDLASIKRVAQRLLSLDTEATMPFEARREWLRNVAAALRFEDELEPYLLRLILGTANEEDIFLAKRPDADIREKLIAELAITGRLLPRRDSIGELVGKDATKENIALLMLFSVGETSRALRGPYKEGAVADACYALEKTIYDVGNILRFYFLDGLFEEVMRPGAFDPADFNPRLMYSDFVFHKDWVAFWNAANESAEDPEEQQLLLDAEARLWSDIPELVADFDVKYAGKR